MEDRLDALLQRFTLKASVFHQGELCSSVAFSDNDGVGYVHVLRGGELTLLTEGGNATTSAEQPMQPISLVFYSKPTCHRLVPNADNTPDLICGTIDFGHAGHNVLSLGLPTALIIPIVEGSQLNAVVNLLFQESDNGACGQQAALNRLCELLILELLRSLMESTERAPGLLTGLADKQLAKALNAMHAHPDKPWTLDTLADVANMSRASFANRFKETVGTSVGQYLTTWRISLAQSLLRDGESVAQVSLAVGYQSPAAMARVFRSQVGQSPTEWLRLVREAAKP